MSTNKRQIRKILCYWISILALGLRASRVLLMCKVIWIYFNFGAILEFCNTMGIRTRLYSARLTFLLSNPLPQGKLQLSFLILLLGPIYLFVYLFNVTFLFVATLSISGYNRKSFFCTPSDTCNKIKIHSLDVLTTAST